MHLVAYWLCTVGAAAELGIGGALDVAGNSAVRDVVAHHPKLRATV